jgi:hypothetical protein
MKRWLALLLVVGCSSKTASPAVVDAAPEETSVIDAPSEATSDAVSDAPSNTNPAAGCATTFGSALTDAFGKLDGFVTAIVRHEDTECAEGTSANHLVLQVKSLGAVYRMVVNIESDRGTDLDVRFADVVHPGLSPWLEGWHAPAGLDYVSMLMVHADATFTITKRDDLVAKLIAAIPIGSKVSVYATSGGGSSAHLVHRNKTNEDGAIVVDPEGASPHWLLFHFADQTF